MTSKAITCLLVGMAFGVYAFDVEVFQPSIRPLPVSFSVPGKKGGAVKSFGVSSNGRPLPVQSEVISRYPDKSPRWYRLTVPAVNGVLEVSPDVNTSLASSSVTLTETSGMTLMENGIVRLEIDTVNGSVLYSRGDAKFSFSPPRVRLPDGSIPGLLHSECRVLSRGPLRAMVRWRGEYAGGKDDADACYWELTISMFADSSYLELMPLVGFYRRRASESAAGEMVRFSSIWLPFSGGDSSVPLTAWIKGGDKFSLCDGERIAQWEFDRFGGDNGKGRDGQLSGVFTQPLSGYQLALVFEEMPEQYPAGLRRRANGFELELLPEIVPRDRYHGRADEHIHTYYLRDGIYSIRGGVEKSYRIYAGLESGTPEAVSAVAGTLAVQPVGLVELDYLNRSGAWPHRVTPPGAFTAPYDAAVKTGAAAYFERQRRERWHGALNWGDWFGERQYNWGNHEYDTPSIFFEHALRFRDPEYFREGLRGARHFIDVDVVKRHPDPANVGSVWAHSLGHTGGYFESGSFKLDNYGQGSAVFIDGRHSAGHTRARGTVMAYIFSGDPRFLEQSVGIAENIRKDGMFRRRDWTLTAREPGWALFNLCSVYDLTADPELLRAANELGDIIIERAAGRGVKFSKLSKWNAPPKPGGMSGEDRKYLTGELSFPTAYQAAGMMELYRLTGRADVRKNLLETAAYVRERLYDRDRHGFIHSPCPWRTQSVRLGGTHGNSLRYVLAFELSENVRGEGETMIADTLAKMFSQREVFDSPLKDESPDYPHPKSFSAAIYFWPQTWDLLGKASGADNQKLNGK